MNEEIMTDYQMKTMLRMILDIVKSSKDKEDAVAKIKELLDD